MKTRTKRIVASLILSVVPASATLAHHSAAAYDTQKEVKISGTVTKYEFKNPHVYITLQVKNADGSSGVMNVEAGAPSVLNPLGFTKDSVKIGDVVTVNGNPSKVVADRTVLGKELYKKDGAYFPLNIGSKSVYTASTATATSIAGTWFSPRTEFNGFLGAAGRWPTTAKGQAAASAYDPKATTQKDCVAIGAPALMFYPVANTITVQKDRVVMKVDWMNSERVVYLDGRKHPAATETSQLGHSVGRWEKDTLIVETTNFKEHAMGLSMQLPSSTQKKLTERFSLSPDKMSLIYTGSVEDPVYLSKAVDFAGKWEYRPNMPHSNEKCDLEVARKFLKQ